MQPNYQELIQHIINQESENLTLDFVKQAKRQFSKKYKLKDVISNIKILREYHKLIKNGDIKENKIFESLLKKRAIRSQSGIVSVQVLTKPFPCPGRCIFCPNDPSMPKSYIKTEPGAMRALLNQFDPYKQVRNRLLSLTLAGHPTDKIEMIVLGGTRDVYPEDYKVDFIKSLYDACNTFEDFFGRVKLADEMDEEKISHPELVSGSKEKSRDAEINSAGQTEKEQSKYGYHVEKVEEIIKEKDRKKAIKTNELAKHRVIGLTIETRPDFITDKSCQMRRDLGITRIEMGVQSMYDEVLSANKRGHGVKEIRESCHKMRQYGFKFSIHIMPGLYKSTIKKDIKTFHKIFSDPFVKPDELKFYPTSVIPNTELYRLYKEGKYRALETDDIRKIIEKVLLEEIPAYTRIKRLIRDIPSTEIAAGSIVTNLSQLSRIDLRKKLKEKKSLRKKLYKRLYPKLKFFEDEASFLSSEKNRKNPTLSKVQSFVIGLFPDLGSERNFASLDTRSREIRNKYGDRRQNSIKDEDRKINDTSGFVIRKYLSSVGTEYFISLEDDLGYLYGFTRLLLPEKGQLANIAGLGEDTAVVRELHVYGNLARLQGDQGEKVQHSGFGKKLMNLAEVISAQHDYKKLSVIAGVGVRKYYEKIGYKIVGTYMLKSIGE